MVDRLRDEIEAEFVVERTGWAAVILLGRRPDPALVRRVFRRFS